MVAFGATMIGCGPGAPPLAVPVLPGTTAAVLPVTFVPTTIPEALPEIVAPLPIDPPPTTTTTTTAPPPEPEPAPPPAPAPAPAPAPKKVRVAAAEPAPAPPLNSAAAAQFTSLTNDVRAAAGVDPLVRDGSLDSLAAAWARELAASGSLRHSSIPRTIIGKPWSTVGENVGYGPSVPAVHDALVGSAGHYANLVGASFTRLGVGAAIDAAGQVWVVEVFAG
jgi:uncharacterized protein YkwD